MEKEYKDKIYDRLLEIKLNIDIGLTPNPQEINQKIGECHAFIEEIEHFSIKVQKELSVIQQALNNSQALLDLKKDSLITQEPIRSLPNIKDREAQSNLLLREERSKVKNYQNELTDLNNLLKAISLKQKNLTRANNDIKLQIRVLDAQIKLGPGSANSVAARGLMEEMHKGTAGKDTFEEALSEAKEDITIDPSEPIDTTSLFMDPKPKTEEEQIVKLAEPMPNSGFDESKIRALDSSEDGPLDEEGNITDRNDDESDSLPPAEDWPIDAKNIISIEKGSTDSNDTEIDNLLHISSFVPSLSLYIPFGSFLKLICT